MLKLNIYVYIFIFVCWRIIEEPMDQLEINYEIEHLTWLKFINWIFCNPIIQHRNMWLITVF